MRLLLQAAQQPLPTTDATRLDAGKIHVRGRSQQAVLKVLPKAVVDGQSDDERGHSRSHTDDGNNGDDTHDALTALGAKITGSNKKLESQAIYSLRHVRFQINGTRGTVRWYSR